MAKSGKFAPKTKTEESFVKAWSEGQIARPKFFSIEQAKVFIKKFTRGRIFAVDFVKRLTGTTRYMVCRYGVRSRAKGIGLRFNPDAKNLIVVFDMIKDQYRMINVPGI